MLRLTKDKELTMTNKPVSNNLSRKQKPRAKGWELAIVPMNRGSLFNTPVRNALKTVQNEESKDSVLYILSKS